MQEGPLIRLARRSRKDEVDRRWVLPFDKSMEKTLPFAEPLVILTSEAASLRKASRALDLEAEGAQIRIWAAALASALWNHPSGVGLAAPQVGWNIRMVAIECSGRKSPVQVWINPVIKRRIGQKVSKEGCLSIPGKSYECSRAKRVEIVAFDVEGKRHAWQCDGLEAICWQHEVDHLDGRLIEDDELRPVR